MAQRRALEPVIAWVLAAATAGWVALLFGFGSGVVTDDPPAVSPYAVGTDATAVNPGRTVFEARCAVCHGSDLEGRVGPPPGAGSRIASLPDGEVRATILEGRGGMPSFEGRLAPEAVDEVIAYLRSRQE